ncbi:hypothetical protein C8R47DRAFT_109122 [Mycena vitilis]|nr:hypothetical protein C8R47DRAFT_109122 [Mycena vitilis]
MSKSRSSRSSSASHSSGLGSGGIAEAAHTAALVYGPPALSDASSDTQMARAIQESKRAYERRSPGASRALSYVSSSSSSTLLGSDSSSSGSGSYYAPSPSRYVSPTPTPRYAADEVIARNLARDWDVASVQSRIVADPRYGTGMPRVVRASSPVHSVQSRLSTHSRSSSASTPSSASSQRTAHDRQYPGHFSPQPLKTPTPSRPLSPLMLPTRLRTPSVRSMASSSSIRATSSSSASIRSVSSARSISTIGSTRSSSSMSSIGSATSRASLSSLLSSVALASRHVPLRDAADSLRLTLNRSPALALARSASSASNRSSVSIRSISSVQSSASSRSSLSGSATPRGPSRASSVRSTTSTIAEGTAITQPEKDALHHLQLLAISPVRCTNPACGATIPPVRFDGIVFPPPPNPNAPTPPPRALLAALHARCPGCFTAHCRGCGAPTFCNGRCDGSPPQNSSAPVSSTGSPQKLIGYTNYPARCTTATHCASARALGAAAALVAFDRAHAAFFTANNPPTPSASSARESDKTLLGPLGTLTFFLSAPPSSGSLASPPVSGMLLGADGGYFSDGGSRAGGGEQPNEEEQDEVHPALPALLGLSSVLGYAAALLRLGTAASGAGVDVGTWMARAPAYGAVLAALRAVADAGGGACARALERPIARGRGVPNRVEVWVRSGTLPKPERAGGGDGEALRDLIRGPGLEHARAALLRLAGATSFGPTVERAHALCDGVLWLLLWDCLGGREG